MRVSNERSMLRASPQNPNEVALPSNEADDKAMMIEDMEIVSIVMSLSTTSGDLTKNKSQESLTANESKPSKPSIELDLHVYTKVCTITDEEVPSTRNESSDSLLGERIVQNQRQVETLVSVISPRQIESSDNLVSTVVAPDNYDTTEANEDPVGRINNKVRSTKNRDDSVITEADIDSTPSQPVKSSDPDTNNLLPITNNLCLFTSEVETVPSVSFKNTSISATEVPTSITRVDASALNDIDVSVVDTTINGPTSNIYHQATVLNNQVDNRSLLETSNSEI